MVQTRSSTPFLLQDHERSIFNLDGRERVLMSSFRSRTPRSPSTRDQRNVSHDFSHSSSVVSFARNQQFFNLQTFLRYLQGYLEHRFCLLSNSQSIHTYCNGWCASRLFWCVTACKKYPGSPSVNKSTFCRRLRQWHSSILFSDISNTCMQDFLFARLKFQTERSGFILFLVCFEVQASTNEEYANSRIHSLTYSPTVNTPSTLREPYL